MLERQPDRLTMLVVSLNNGWRSSGGASLRESGRTPAAVVRRSRRAILAHQLGLLRQPPLGPLAAGQIDGADHPHIALANALTTDFDIIDWQLTAMG